MGQDKINILQQAIDTFGRTSQKVVAIEELAELQKEITKEIRGQGNIDNIIEEMADVYIMLEQLQIMYSINTEDIAREVNFKTDRLSLRLKEGNHTL